MNDRAPSDLGPAHGRLRALAGRWRYEGTLALEGEPRLVLDGTSRNRLLFGGRFLCTAVNGRILTEGTDDPPQPFRGRGTLGFDLAQDRYTSTWISSTDTEIACLEGEWSDAARAFVLRGLMNDPLTGTRIETTEVTTVRPDGTHHFLKSIGTDDVPILSVEYRRES